jgi:transcriptional regulator with XRE-family HTH domain/regulator of replication initiation timing
MGAKIPSPIKAEIIRKWLQGISRDQIANEAHVGAGTVSGIINEGRKKDPQFNLLREVAVNLKKNGLNIESFAPLIRLRKVLEDKEWLLDNSEGKEGEVEGFDDKTETKIESLIISLEVFCFKQNLSVKDFFDRVNEIYSAAEKLDVPLDELPSYIRQLKGNVQNLLIEIDQIKLEKQKALKDNDATLNVLEEFKKSRPLFNNNLQLKEELEKVKHEKDNLEREGFWKRKEEQSKWTVPASELADANRDLGSSVGSDGNLIRTITSQELKDMVMDLFYHPSKYIKAIRQIMGIYDLEVDRKGAGYRNINDT